MSQKRTRTDPDGKKGTPGRPQRVVVPTLQDTSALYRQVYADAVDALHMSSAGHPVIHNMCTRVDPALRSTAIKALADALDGTGQTAALVDLCTIAVFPGASRRNLYTHDFNIVSEASLRKQIQQAITGRDAAVVRLGPHKSTLLPFPRDTDLTAWYNGDAATGIDIYVTRVGDTLALICTKKE